MTNSTQSAIKYTISFDKKEAKRSAGTIHSLLEKMQKMVEALGKRAIAAKQMMMDAMRGSVGVVARAFQSFKQTMTRIFAPLIWLKDKFITGWKVLLILIGATKNALAETEEIWYGLKQSTNAYMRNLLGIGQEHKRHNEYLEEKLSIWQKVVDKAKRYKEQLEAAALATPAVMLAARAGREVALQQTLVREGVSKEFARKLPLESRKSFQRTAVKPEDVNKIMGNLASRGVAENEIMGPGGAGDLVANMMRVFNLGSPDEAIDNFVKLRIGIGKTQEEISNLVSGMQKVAQITPVKLGELFNTIPESIDMMEKLTITTKEAQNEFMKQMSVIEGTFAGTDVNVKGFIEELGKGFLSGDNDKLLANFMGMTPTDARALVRSGNLVPIVEEIMKGLSKAKEMGNADEYFNMVELMFGADAAKQLTAMQLAGRDLSGTLAKAQEAFGKLAEPPEFTWINKLQIMWGEIGVILTRIGMKLLPLLEGFVDFMYEGFLKIQKPLEEFADTVGTIIVSIMALIKPAKWLAGAFITILGAALTFLIEKVFKLHLKIWLFFKTRFVYRPLADAFNKIGMAAGIADSKVGKMFRTIGYFFERLSDRKGVRTFWQFLNKEFPTVANKIRFVGGRIIWVVSVIIELYNWIKRFKELGGFDDLSRAFGNIGELFAPGGGGLADRAEAFLSSITKMYDSASLLIKLALPVLWFMNEWASSILKFDDGTFSLKQTMQRIEDIWTGYKAAVVELWNDIKFFLNGLASAVRQMVSDTIVSVLPFGEQIKAVFDTVLGYIKTFWEKAKGIYSDISGFVKEHFGFDPSSMFKGINKFLNNFSALEEKGKAIREGRQRSPEKRSQVPFPIGPAEQLIPSLSVRGIQEMPQMFQKKMLQKMDTRIAAAADKYGIPRELFYSLVKQESGFNPNAVSKAGAMGLTQLMPGTAADLGLKTKKDIMDPAKNLDAGARYLSQMYKKFGDWNLALAAYNAGPGNVQKYGNTIPPFDETQDYVSKITTNWKNMMGEEGIGGDTPQIIVKQDDVVGELRNIRILLERQQSLFVSTDSISGTPSKTGATGVLQELATGAM